MNRESLWLFNRPLDVDKDSSIFISRAVDIAKIKDLISRDKKVIYLWSPPKSGTTTFLKELEKILVLENRQVYLLDCRVIVSDTSYMKINSEWDILLFDELEEIRSREELTGILDYINTLISNKKIVILAGDKTAFKLIHDNPQQFSTLKEDLSEVELSVLNCQEVGQKLMIETLKDSEYKVSLDAAMELCKRTGGHLYLIQRLADEFWKYIQNNSIKSAGEAEMAAFLTKANEWVKDYFDNLIDRIIRDKKGPYEILDLINNNLKVNSNALKGLGIIRYDSSRNGFTFASTLHHNVLKAICTPRKLAQRFSLAQEWEKAEEFFDKHLANWCENNDEKKETLLESMNASFAAKKSAKYAADARRVSQVMAKAERNSWLKEKFIPQEVKLIESADRKDFNRSFHAIAHAVDAITRTGRVRLYLTDKNDKRLICRAALGIFAEDFKRESVQISSNDWGITKAYLNKKFIDIRNTSKSTDVNEKAANTYQVHSAWLFPLFERTDAYCDESLDGRVVGVLSVDNYHHSDDPPDEEDKELIRELMGHVVPSLIQAQDIANTHDIEFRMGRITSLHQYLLAVNPVEEILDKLFKVAFEIQLNLSMIVVRLFTGYHRNRLEIVNYSPSQLKHILERNDIKIIDTSESKISELFNNSNQQEVDYDFVLDVHHELKEGTALHKVVTAIDDMKLGIKLGSLLSFKLKTDRDELGVCNIYSKIPYKFSNDEINLLASVVKQTAVAIYNAQRIEGTKRQRRGLEILSECIARITDESMTPIELKASLCQQLGELFKAESATFVGADNEKRQLIVECSWPVENIINKELRVLPWGMGTTGESIRTLKPCVLSVKDRAWGKQYVPHIKNVNTSAAIPMMNVNGQPIGAFVLESTKEDAFTPEDVQLIETVVKQVPVAMNTAELVDDLRSTNKALLAAHEELKNTYPLKVMGEFVGAVVHRMTNYAMPIKSSATAALLEVQASKLDKTNVISSKLEELVRYGGQLQDLLYKFKQSVTPIKKTEEINLRQLAKDIGDKIDLNFKWDLQIAENSSVITERLKLHLVLECIMENGYQATARKWLSPEERHYRSVVVKCQETPDICNISVTDNGDGIPQPLQDRLFRNIVQSIDERGNGFGLFISFQLAMRLQGKLTIVESSVAKGTTILLSIPQLISVGE